MFSSNTLVTGGIFTQQHYDQRQYNVQGAKGGFEFLKDAVSPAAFHNSGERFDPPKCHPNTRVAILKKIMDWILGCDPEVRNALIMWLSGAAGSGKSAIAQSIAELCCSEGRLLASFFFGRSDPTRNHAGSLIATISYQVCSTIPTVRDRITLAIENDPLVFTRSLTTQLTSLLVDPLQDLFNSGYFNHPDSPRLILIDGLDECLDHRVQQNILDTIAHAIQQFHVPFLFLISSRPEHDILTGFNSTTMRGILTRVILDNSYNADDDIELFLRDEFSDIKKNHPFKQLIPPSWPTDEVISKLVQKSSGQFIYASTVIKYVKSSRHRPTHHLDIILNLRPAHKDLPFMELDALYAHVLSSAEDFEPVLNVLSLAILSEYPSAIEEIEKILLLDPGEGQLLMCDLGSIVSFYASGDSCHYVQILHASLVDFLVDQSRSSKFYIDIALKRTEILSKCFQFLTYHSFTVESDSDTDRLAMNFITVNLEKSAPTAELRDAILGFSIAYIYEEASGAAEGARIAQSSIPFFNFCFLPLFFTHLKKLGKYADELLAHHFQSFDCVLTQQLDIYYSSMPLTLLIALIDFCIMNAKESWQRDIIFSSNFTLFNMESDLLDIDQSNLSLIGSRHYTPPDYLPLVYNFFHDPIRHGKCQLDGQRYATAALCCLMYLCDAHSAPHVGLRFPRQIRHENRIRRNTPWIWRRKLDVNKNAMIWKTKQSDDICRSAKGRFSLPAAPGFSDDDLKNPVIRQGMWSEKYAFGLEYLLYFLSRSGRSEELIQFCRQHTFAPRSREFPKQMKKVRHSIAKYLEKMESGE